MTRWLLSLAASLCLATPALAQLTSPYLRQDAVLFVGAGPTLYVVELLEAAPKPAEVAYATLAAEAACSALAANPGRFTLPLAVTFVDAMVTPMGLLPLGEPRAVETVEACGEGA